VPYLFGDTDRAAYRLKVVADVFANSTRAFIHETVDEQPQHAIDPGCGPGYTTHLLADLFPSTRIVGLDSSAHFISLAQKTSTPRVSFHVHDVTTVPFPTDQANLLTCRFLLTHLQDPPTVIERWATQLQPGGLLLMEEVEQIHTNNALFTTYLKIQATLLEQQANQLYIGPALNALSDSTMLKRRASRTLRFQIPTFQAATMFFLNIQTLKHHPFIQQHYAPTLIAQMEEALRKLSELSGDQSDIAWEMRQIAFERL
jgi:ubiquinone/menaquinone biosynthesis C-methylase UbiE